MASNSTSTGSPSTQDPPSVPNTSRTTAPTNTPPSPVPSVTSEPPKSVTLPPTSSREPPPSSEPTPKSTTSPTTTSSTTPPPITSSTTTTTPITTIKSSVITTDEGNGPITTTRYRTVTELPPPPVSESSPAAPSSTTSGAAINPGDSGSGGLSSSGKIAVAVVVPIAAVALLVLAGIYLWRKRKQRKAAEEERRKEVEDYTYNPNADPTIPAVAAAGFPMKDDASSGYRGWGSTTLASSTGRKASTTMSGGAAGVAYSDATSPTRGGLSDTRSGEPLVHDGSPPSPEGEILGAMGPSASNNRGGDVHRGLSNASSSYSNARSDTSGDGPIGAAYGAGGAQYYDQYGNGNPYADGGYTQQGAGQESTGAGGQPVIRDVTARRNTRIENPAHYPQQSVGISQNF